jgi:hypothetical protein
MDIYKLSCEGVCSIGVHLDQFYILELKFQVVENIVIKWHYFGKFQIFLVSVLRLVCFVELVYALRIFLNL